MKSILISIQPQWVEKILNKEKTIKIRKTKPSCELPVKVYIYCTKGKPYLYRIDDDNNFELTNNFRPQEDSFVKDYNAQNGKVVAEFTLNKITKHEKNFIDCEGNICYNFKVCDVKNAGFDRDVFSLLDFDNFIEDYGKGKPLYAWHIDDLVVYDKPKELSEFKKWIDVDKLPCSHCQYAEFDWSEYAECCAIDYDGTDCVYKQIKRPPQSYMMVESLGDDYE